MLGLNLHLSVAMVFVLRQKNECALYNSAEDVLESKSLLVIVFGQNILGY